MHKLEIVYVFVPQKRSMHDLQRYPSNQFGRYRRVLKLEKCIIQSISYISNMYICSALLKRNRNGK